MERHKGHACVLGAAELAQLKTTLTRRLHVLRAALREQGEAGHRAHEPAVAEVHDLKDEAFAGQLTNLTGLARQQTTAELGAVQSALRRIDEGSYGRCEDCDRAIGHDRLLAQPAAPRCLPCQERAEGRQHAR